MGLTDTGKAFALEALGAVAVKVRLLDELGGEIVNHSGVSQDKTITWDSATAGAISTTVAVSFQVKAGVTVAAISFRNNAGDVEYGRDELAPGAQETYANDGTYTLTSAEINLNAV